jgi:hypothetical protein
LEYLKKIRFYLRFLKSENSKPKWNKGFLASIWATKYLAGIVISVKNLDLKFRSYIAEYQISAIGLICDKLEIVQVLKRSKFLCSPLNISL